MVISESAVNMQSKREFTAKSTMTHSRSTGNLLLFSDTTGGSVGLVEGKASSGEEGRTYSNVHTGKSAGIYRPEERAEDRSAATRLRFSTLIYLWRQMFRAGGNSTIDRIMEHLMDSTGYTFVTDYTSYSYEESESTSFSFTGEVRTADGRSIEFDVNVGMSRSFMEEYSICEQSVVRNAYLDPLVINLDCKTCDVKSQTFMFDLNCDGQEDEIGRLSEGSGFLALDVNGNGTIDDGSELFGTKSGNGFYDLSFYDEDGNGWIDENDSVFSKLRIMTVDSEGKQHTYGLKESDVGAIYLGEIKSQFSVTDSANNEMARIKSSGLFLRESGGTGVMQNIDYVMRKSS